MMNKIWIFFLLLICASCDDATDLAQKEQPHGRVVHVCQWAENFAPEIIQQFEQETGIKVVIDEIDSNEGLESKLFASRTGYDLVFPSMIPNFLRQHAAGIYTPLDLNRLPNFKHLDMKLLKFLMGVDGRVYYGLPYVWGTTGLGYNIQKVKELIPDVPLDSWQLVFDPKVVSKLQSCGVALQDSAVEVFPAIQFYLGLDHTSEAPDILKKTGEAFAEIRQYVRKFQGMQSLEDLARGDVCVAQVWSGEALRASLWAKGMGEDRGIGYILPKEGAVVWADMMAIPKDAPHLNEAYILLNFLMRPDVMAKNSLYVQAPTVGRTARQFLPQDFLNNPMVYPSQKMMQKLHRDAVHTPSYEIETTRLLTKIILLNPKKKHS